MVKLFLSICFMISLAVPASALEIEAPEVPQAGAKYMPEQTDSFGSALTELFSDALKLIRPDLASASEVSLSVLCVVILLSILQPFSGNAKLVLQTAGSAAVTSILLFNVNSMIQLATQTVRDLSNYGKLLYPVMTAAMAAQGGVTTSTALYTGTAIFNAFLSSLISGVLVPMVYLFLAMAAANSAVGEDVLKKLSELIKNVINWSLKTILTVFTTYMSITGVVSGTTDAVALKATKVTIASVVPVIGGILSDSSEAILVSAGIMKNTAGVYGILAVLAVFLEPCIRIGTHYLLLKATAAVCSIFGTKKIVDLIDDFSAAMGLLLGMTSAVCLLLLISTICFMKGVG